MNGMPVNVLRRAVLLGLSAVLLTVPARAGGAFHPELEAQKRHIAALERLVATLHERQAEVEARVEQLETVRGEIAELRAQIEAMTTRMESLEGEIRSLLTEFADYQSEYRKAARIAAVGETIPVLVAGNGKTYEEITIRRVTDAGLDIVHSAGPTRLRFDELPGDLRARFQWDAEEAEAVFDKEREMRRERERQLAENRELEKEKREAAAQAATDERVSKLERQLAAVRSTVSTSRLHSSGRLGERRQLGSGTRYYSRHTSYVNYGNSGRYYPRYSRVGSRSSIDYSRNSGRIPTISTVNSGRGRMTNHSGPRSVVRRPSPPPSPPRTTTPVRRCPGD